MVFEALTRWRGHIHSCVSLCPSCAHIGRVDASTLVVHYWLYRKVVFQTLDLGFVSGYVSHDLVGHQCSLGGMDVGFLRHLVKGDRKSVLLGLGFGFVILVRTSTCLTYLFWEMCLLGRVVVFASMAAAAFLSMEPKTLKYMLFFTSLTTLFPTS